MLNRRDWAKRAAAVASAATWPQAWAADTPAPNASLSSGITSPVLADIASRYFADQLELNPLQGSATLGGPKYEGRMAITISPEHQAATLALDERVKRELAALPLEPLSADDRLTHELLSREVQLSIEGSAFPDHLMPIDQYGGMPVALSNWAGGDQLQALKTPTDYVNYLKRLRRIPEFNQQAIVNMREGVARGYTVPRPLVQSALPMLKALTAPKLDQSPFGAALRAMPAGFDPADRTRITREYVQAYEKDIRPSMLGLLAFLQGPYLRACRTSAGISAIPNGEAYYAYLVRLQTTTDMAPDRIHALGLTEVERIHGEMAKLQRGFGHKGSINEFLKWHEAQPRFRPFRSWDDILTAYYALNERVTPQLPHLFGKLPKQPLQIRAIPELQRATTSPYYSAPSQDGSRPGIFFVGAPTTPDKYNNSEMTSLLLHEGQPGHHFHTSLQFDLPLPAFRRFGWNDAFGEGWALYSETLGHEMGLYDDPNQHLGHLKMELLRAVRLVTDTGLHAKGWTRERTMDYMVRNEGITAAQAKQATERYMASPGQALAYKIGALKIQELRQRSKQQLGERFSLSAFHDRVLSQGTLPLQVLERQIDGWIASQRPATA
ncbi:DUF885 domain-containing protein [Ideonella sp. DXS29W]|uniref:DUF885 domain-containing protein n=1 Tax=Ideonella lacteola TaxID=2984193 RepID=A0ABU9BSP8_9BURK